MEDGKNSLITLIYTCSSDGRTIGKNTMDILVSIYKLAGKIWEGPGRKADFNCGKGQTLWLSAGEIMHNRDSLP